MLLQESYIPKYRDNIIPTDLWVTKIESSYLDYKYYYYTRVARRHIVNFRYNRII